jgi:hypothetical protein
VRTPHYIALIHKDHDSGYGVSFPDVPGVITVADTLDDALMQASEVGKANCPSRETSKPCVVTPIFSTRQKTRSLLR